MRVTLHLPSGSKERNPGEKRLRDLMSISDANFWVRGTGSAGVTVESVSGSPSLLIARKDPFGFHLQYGLIDDTETLVSVSTTEYRYFTDIVLGGEPWRIPTAFFVPEDAATTAVLQFARDGKVPDNVKWVSLSDQEW